MITRNTRTLRHFIDLDALSYLDRAGKGDSPQADGFRDAMEATWNTATDEEREFFGFMSERMYETPAVDLRDFDAMIATFNIATIIARMTA